MSTSARRRTSNLSTNSTDASTEDSASQQSDSPSRHLLTKQSTRNLLSSSKFPYEPLQKIPFSTRSDDFKKIFNLTDVDTFWRKKDADLVEDFMDSLEYVMSVKLSQKHLEQHSQEVLKLIQVQQCLLEMRDTDAINAEDLEEDLKKAQKEKDILRQDLDALHKETQSLKTESQSRQGKIHQRELEDKDAEIAEWRKRCYDKDIVISDINASLDEAKRRAREFETNQVKLEQKVRRYKDEVSSLAVMEKKMRGRNAEDDNLISRLEDKVDALTTEREEMRTELEENTDRMLQLQKLLDEAKAGENELRQTIRANQNEINERIRDTEERAKEVADLREQLESLQESHEKELNDMEDGFMADIEALQKQNQVLLEEIQATADVNAALQTQIQEMGKPPTNVQTRFATVISKIDNLRRSSKAESDASSISEQLATFDAESAELLRELQEENTSLKERIQNLEDILQEERNKSQESVKIVEELLPDNVHEQFETMRTRKEHLEDELHTTQESMKDFEKELIHLKQTIKAYEDGVSGLEIAKRDIRYHKEQLVKREETIERYKRLLNMLLNNIEDFRWTILGLYKEHQTPKDKQIDVNKMKEDIERKLLDELLRNERRRLQGSNEDLDTLKREHNLELKKLQKEIDKLVEEVKRLSQQNNALQMEYDTTRVNLQSATVQIRDLEAQMMQAQSVPATPIPQADMSLSFSEPPMREEYERLKAKNEQLKQEITRLRIELKNGSNAMSELETLRSKHDKALHEISVMHESKSALQKENAALKKEMETLLQRIAQLSKEDKAQRQRMKQLLAEISSLKQEKEKIEQTLAQTKALLQQLKDRPQDVREVIKPDDALVSRLEQQLSAAQSQLSTLRLNFDAEKQAHASTKRMLLETETKLSHLKREYEDLRQDNLLSAQRADALKQQLENAQRELSMASGSGADSSSRASTQQTALLQAQKQIRDLLRQLEDAKDEVATLNDEVALLKEMQEGSKLREEEWKKIQDRLAYHEQTLASDQDAIKEQSKNTMKQIIAGYNAIITQKEATIQKYAQEFDSLRRSMLSEKRIHQDELDRYKRLLSKNDVKLLQNLHSSASTIENEAPAEPSAAQGMALEDVEEMMAEKNYTIHSLQEEVVALRNELSDLKKDRNGKIESYFVTKKRLESELQRQEEEIAELRLSVQLHETNSATFVRMEPVAPQSPMRKTQNATTAAPRLKKISAMLEAERETNAILKQQVNQLTNTIKKQQLESTQQLVMQQKSPSSKDVTRLLNKRTLDLRSEAAQLKRQVEQLNVELYERSQTIERLQERNISSAREAKELEDLLRRKSESHSLLKKKQKKLEKEVYSLRLRESGVGSSLDDGVGIDSFSGKKRKMELAM